MRRPAIVGRWLGRIADGTPPWIFAPTAQAVEASPGMPVADRFLESVAAVEPHLSWSEWHFSRRSVTDVADLAAKAVTVLFLGMPSVAAELVGHPGVEMVDINALNRRRYPKLAELADAHYCDVASRITGPQVELTLMDPPWHVDEALRWLQVAATRTAPRGRIVTTLFHPGLTLEAPRERAQLLAAFRSLGRTRILDLDVRYSTPLFESRTMHALGLVDPGDWRVGQLVEIQLGHLYTAPPPVPSVDPYRAWETYLIGSQVVRLRPHHRRQLPGFHAPVTGFPDYQLRSVSRSQLRALDFDIWTSRNRVALIKDTTAAAGVLAQLRESVAPRWQFGWESPLDDLLEL
ncbi:MAG TPA: hypothetical protein DEV93_07865 [Chloroflexi bacterium]|nr:hypothetical protein [Chloroflexota bacterium]